MTRTEYDGTITVLLDQFDGKPLNSPNDVVVKSDDSIWFTDLTDISLGFRFRRTGWGKGYATEG